MVVVLKLGGSVLDVGVHPSLMDDIKAVHEKEGLVLVHGGGDEVTRVAEKLGKEQKFVVSPEGIKSRYTDKETAGIYTMVMVGKINKEVTASLLKKGIKAVGLSGIDGALIEADRKKKLIVVDERGRKIITDGGYTGKIRSVNSEFAHMLLEKGYLPVIAPVALSEEFEFLNVDSDRAAAYVAGGLKADKIIFLSDVPGVLLDGKVVGRTRLTEAEDLMKKVGFGMEKKVLACIESVKMGVKESIIASGVKEHPLLNALSSEERTTIVP